MKRRYQYLVLVLAFAGLSLVLNPFQYDQGNSGRYLLPVLRDLDSSLFQNDPDVESLRLFGSGFYVAMSWLFATAEMPVDQIETAMIGLFVITRFLLALAIVYLAKILADNAKERLFLTAMLLAWCSYPIGVPVAGVSISDTTMNHGTLSEVAMVLSLALVIAGRLGWLTAVNAADVWIHPLMALHRMGALAPAMFVRCTDRKRAVRVFGLLAVLAVSAAAYWAVLAPPSLDRQEAEIFVAAKGLMVHTSPFDQPWSAWIQLAYVVVLAWCATQRFTAGLSDDRSRLIWWTIGSGVIAALILSAITHMVQLPLLIRLQPMRMFMLPWFGCVALIAVGTTRAVLRKDPAWPWLAATIATSILHGGLFIIAAGMAAVVLLVQTYGGPPVRSWVATRVIFGGLTVASVAVALASDRSPHFLLGAVVLVAVFSLSMVHVSNGVLGTGLLAFFLVAGAISSRVYFRVERAESTGRPRIDPDFFAALEWIRDNTADEARFATQPDMAFFRARSLRTSVNEAVSAIVWVDPRQSVEHKQQADAVNMIFEAGELPWDRGELKEISSKLGFEYVLTRQKDYLTTEPEYVSGPFAIYRVR